MIDDIGKLPANSDHIFDDEEGLEDTREDRSRTSPAAQAYMAYNAQINALTNEEDK